MSIITLCSQPSPPQQEDHVQRNAVRACCISGCSSHDSDYKQQRNNSDFLPLTATAALHPPQSSSWCLGGNSNPQKSSAPSSGVHAFPFQQTTTTMTVRTSPTRPVAPRPPTSSTSSTTFPFLAFIVRSVALLWVWATDEATTLWPRPRLRLRSRTFDKMTMGQKKGGCRCRVCMLRTQALSQPLHNVKVPMVEEGK